MNSNPFTPNFGQVPYQLAGRKELIYELKNAYDNAPGDPALTSMLIGARGTGKTALLTYVSQQVQQQGWISVNVPCVTGMMEDIYQQILKNAQHVIREKSSRVTDVALKASIAVVSAEVGIRKNDSGTVPNWRIRMTDILEDLNDQGIGVLITIDEINTSLQEMIDFAAIYQMFIREERKIGLLMAGLPSQVSSLLRNESVSFLRRASQYHLESIPDYEIEDAFIKTAIAGGKTIDNDALHMAGKAVMGFPFMLQLIGYRTWIEAKDSDVITLEHIKKGIELAKKDLKTRVLKPTFDEISDVGLQILLSMKQDEEYSLTKDIANRLGKSSGYVATYKKRLIELGVIEDAGRGKIKYALPMMREYLEEY